MPVIAGDLLGAAKVSELHVAVHIEQQVLRLQVAVHNTLRVQILDDEGEL